MVESPYLNGRGTVLIFWRI